MNGDCDLRLVRRPWQNLLGCGLLLLTLANASPAAAAPLDIARPEPGQYVQDLANLISPADEQHIQQSAERLLAEKGTPLMVVTIDSMGKHGGWGKSIETFAHALFTQWDIGAPQAGQANGSKGILLVVSKDDHRARIELGPGWGHSKDGASQTIMKHQIVRRFKLSDFSGGISHGVDALDKMAREQPLPVRHVPVGNIVGQVVLWLAVIALAFFSILSFVQQGTEGWAWAFWCVVFSILGMVLYAFLTSGRYHRRHRGFGGFLGGSYGGYSGGGYSGGGGFSGGGGATGSW